MRNSLVGGGAVRVIAGGMRRIDTLRALVGAATAPWLLLHDVVHPFVTTELSQRVIEEAHRVGAAAAALPNVDFLYGTDGTLRAAPGDVVAIQKPVAFRRSRCRAWVRGGGPYRIGRPRSRPELGGRSCACRTERCLRARAP